MTSAAFLSGDDVPPKAPHGTCTFGESSFSARGVTFTNLFCCRRRPKLRIGNVKDAAALFVAPTVVVGVVVLVVVKEEDSIIVRKKILFGR
tara:strand:- start:1255 stop:1527 length:273 start_codon:yes stop_codon:yes gene_type:complete